MKWRWTDWILTSHMGLLMTAHGAAVRWVGHYTNRYPPAYPTYIVERRWNVQISWKVARGQGMTIYGRDSYHRSCRVVQWLRLISLNAFWCLWNPIQNLFDFFKRFTYGSTNEPIIRDPLARKDRYWVWFSEYFYNVPEVGTQIKVFKAWLKVSDYREIEGKYSIPRSLEITSLVLMGDIWPISSLGLCILCKLCNAHDQSLTLLTFLVKVTHTSTETMNPFLDLSVCSLARTNVWFSCKRYRFLHRNIVTHTA